MSVANDHEQPWRVQQTRRRQLEIVCTFRYCMHLKLNRLPPTAREHRPVFPPWRINILTNTATRTDGSKNVTNGREQWRRHDVYTNDHLQLMFRRTNLVPPPSVTKSIRYQPTNPPNGLGHILDGTRWLRASFIETNLTKILYVTSGARVTFLWQGRG